MMLQHWKSLTALDPVDTGLAQSQFTRAASAEEKLMLAVLENAIEQFQEYALAEDPKGKAMFVEAEEWLSEKNSDWFFSFENICETLRLSPDYLLQGLILWRKARTQDCEINALYRRPTARRRTKTLAALPRTQRR
jgi:hypothetical protein